MTDNQTLLAQYAREGSEQAFQELVSHYLDLVYSTARRLVGGDTHLAEDVTQMVFTDFAREARNLPADVMLGGWLHRHTYFVASKTVRGERRRQSRERQVVEMHSTEDHSAENLAQVAPLLDEAINQLDPDDRAAILLRYFERQDLRSVGRAIGASENAAQKRVARALEELRVLLQRRGIALSAAGLASVLGAHAVSAAPAGLLLSVSQAALAAAATTAAASGGSTLTTIKIITMTKLQYALIGAVLVAAVGTPFVIHNQLKSSAETEAIRQQLSQATAETSRLSNLLAQAEQATQTARESELAAVSQARQALNSSATSAVPPKAASAATTASATKTNDTSVLGGMTGDPSVRKLIRDSQKAGMKMIYAGLSKELNLTTDQADRINDILADNIMENVDQITKVLREGKSPEERSQIFSALDAGLQEKLKAELGADRYSQFEDYTHNLLATLTTEQFKATLGTDQKISQQQSDQLLQILKEESASAIFRAGLDRNYQPIPMLNFQNFASEEDMNKSLGLLQEIYKNVSNRAASILPAETLAKFGDFQNTAINNNRAAIVMNQKMMAPAQGQ
jgi:RNA polymerase sigma factor (sigma-70 family)